MFDEGQDIYSALGESHWWLTGRYTILENYIKRFAPNREVRFLDAGCGPAMFLKRLSRFIRGELHGIDSSSYGLALARANLPDAHYTMGDICSLPFESDHFDLILADDVIEHIADDRRALREIYRTLRPGGHAFFAVPAFMGLWGYHDEKYGHMRRYTIAEFDAKLREAGFETIDVMTYGQAAFFLPLWLFRKTKAAVGSKREDFARLPTVLNRLLHMLVQIDFALCRLLRLPFGCNIFCVVTKGDAP